VFTSLYIYSRRQNHRYLIQNNEWFFLTQSKMKDNLITGKRYFDVSNNQIIELKFYTNYKHYFLFRDGFDIIEKQESELKSIFGNIDDAKKELIKRLEK
jgi:hypothetical protein